MSGVRQVLLGAATAFLSIVIILGSLMMALTEESRRIAAASGPTNSPSPPISLVTLRPGQPTPTAHTALLSTETPTILPLETDCTIPPDWVEVEVQVGDTLESLALASGVTVAELRDGNCMWFDGLVAGSILFAPIKASPTPTTTATFTSTATRRVKPTKVPQRCGPPAGWVIYIVRPGDNLFRIGQAYGISWQELQRANCLDTTTIRVGQRLYVPNVPPKTTPPAKATATPVLSSPAIPTATPVVQTRVPASATPLPPTPVTPSPTAVPPSPTPQPPSPTPIPPSDTPVPPTSAPPTLAPVTLMPTIVTVVPNISTEEVPSPKFTSPPEVVVAQKADIDNTKLPLQKIRIGR